MRKIKITKSQLNELLNSDLMFSTDSTQEYVGSTVSTTEPVGDNNFGEPLTTDDHEKSMPPSPLSRMGRNSNYNGPAIV